MKPQEASTQLLYKGHPSFGTEKAVFLFALGTGPTRILSVQATNPWAVLCMERLLLADGKASENCRVIQVIRDYTSIGTRDELAQEVPFVDFMLDIADMDRMLGGDRDDALIMQTFKNSLSDAERQQAMLKMRAVREVPPENIFAGYGASVSQALPSSIAPVVVETQEDQADKLTSALVNMGFKKPEVRRFVADLGNKTRTDDMHSLIREGLRALAA